jgi:hypothetical protein
MKTGALGMEAASFCDTLDGYEPGISIAKDIVNSPTRRETPKKIFRFLSLFHRNLQNKVTKHRNHG